MIPFDYDLIAGFQAETMGEAFWWGFAWTFCVMALRLVALMVARALLRSANISTIEGDE